MPGGEQRQFDGQLNDDYNIEVLVYRKSLKNVSLVSDYLKLVVLDSRIISSKRHKILHVVRYVDGSDRFPGASGKSCISC